MNKVTIIRSIADIEPRTGRTISSLHRANYEVTFLALDRDRTFPGTEHLPEANVKRFRIKWFKRSVGSVFILPIWWTYIFLTLVRKNYDYVHCIDLDTLPPAYFAAKLRRMKIIYEIYDYAPDIYPDSFGIPQARTFLKKIEDFFITRVDGLIIADDIRFAQVGEDIIKKCKNVTVVYNSPADAYKPATRENNRIFTIFYGGILEKDRGIQYLIRAVAGLEDVELVLAGYGHMEQEVENAAKEYPNIRYLGKLDYKDIITNTRRADLVPCLYDPKIPNNIYASPNKFFESLMLGKPSLAYEETLFSRRLLEHNCGVTIAHKGDVVEQLREAIQRLASNEQLRASMSKNARELYVSEFSEEQNDGRLRAFFSKVSA